MKYLGRITDDNDLVNKKYVDDTVAESENIIANEYSSSSTYALGSYVIYEDNLYRCTTAITTAEAWNSAHWTQVSVGGEFVNNKNAHNTLQNLIGANTQLITGELENTANFYNPANTYNVGDYVLQSVTTQSGTKYNLFRCTTQISTPEAWNSSHWVQTTIGEDLSNTVTQEDLEQFAFGEIFQLRSNSVNKGLNWDWDNTTLHLHGTQIKDPNVTYDSSFYSIFYGQIANSCIIPGSNLALTNSKISGGANNPPYLNMNFYGEGGSLLDDRSFNLNTTRTNTQILVPDGTLSVDIFIVKDYVAGSENVDWTGKIQLFGYVNGQIIGDTFNKVAEDLSDLESDVSNVKSALNETEKLFSDGSTLLSNSLSDKDGTNVGVSYSLVGNTITLSGTATGESFFAVLGTTTSAPPSWLVGGKSYVVTIQNTTGGSVLLQGKQTSVTTHHNFATYAEQGRYIFTPPADMTTFRIGIYVPTGTTVSGTITIEISNAISPVDVKNSSNATNFNTFKGLKNEYNDVMPYLDINETTVSGVTFTSDGMKYHVSGTLTGDMANKNIYYISSALDNLFSENSTVCVVSTNPGQLFLQLYFYINGSLSTDVRYDLKHGLNTIGPTPAGATGVLLRVHTEGRNSVFNDDISFSFAYGNKVKIPHLPGATDVTNVIRAALEKYGECWLESGTYHVTDLVMPAKTAIHGCGKASQLYLKAAGNFAIQMDDFCLVENLSIVGNLNEITLSSTVGERHGILWTKFSDDHIPTMGNVTNVWINGFTGGGITCDNTGTGTEKNLNVCNAHIWNCNAGINIAYSSEFHRFTNVDCWMCYYGCVNNGGNNILVNCSFSKNIVGFIVKMVDGSGRTMPNNTHGSAIGCSFNHTNYDATTLGTGEAIHIEDGRSGFVFSGGQLFYGSIYIKDSSAVCFRDFNFGAMKNSGGDFIGLTIEIETTDGTSNKKQFFSNSVFYRTPNIVYTNEYGTGEIIWNDCYTRTGSAISNPT